MLVPIANINCSDRIREPDADTVRGLAESMAIVGLINAVTVSPTTVVRDGQAQTGYILVAGANRLEAAKLLGWTQIEATVTDLTGPRAVIAECDENLRGPHLTASERALFTRRRKEAYEALHPETRAHVAGAHGSNRAQGNASAKLAPAFTADTAANTGQSERAVQRDAQRGEKSG